jgi:Zn-dependent protease
VENQPSNGTERVGAAPGLDERRASVDAPAAVTCPSCGTEVAAALLACPACGWLRFSNELKRLASVADEHERAGRFTEALTAWRTALDLLPSSSRQHDVIGDRIAELTRKGPAQSDKHRPDWTRRAGVIGAIALFLWKFKVVIAFLLTKGKLLLLGFTKGGTFFSMLLSIGLYWQVFGWKWAVGVVTGIYVHEMGHVAMLRHYGMPFSAPMFIPGFGAFIRTRHYPKEPVAEARVGLAGPIWGLGAALFCYLVYRLTGLEAWGAIARILGLFNLLNLMPVWQLDGAHGFKALTRPQRWIATGATALAWIWTTNMLLVLLPVTAGLAAFGGKPASEPDRRTLIEYLVLVGALTALTTIHVPVTVLE